jgi:hypothetical protein
MTHGLRQPARIVLLALFLSVIGSGAIARDSDDDAGTGQWMPTGQRITPTAASGATFEELDPGLGDVPAFRVGARAGREARRA